MDALDLFLEDGLDDHTRCVILDFVEKAVNTGIERDELTFNCYSIEFYFKEKKVTVYDEIARSSGLPGHIGLDEFLDIISAKG